MTDSRRRSSTVEEPLTIPYEQWESVQSRVGKNWKPIDNPHHTIIGQTGSGKSFLIRHGILPLVKFDHVLILDVKGGDPTLAGCGLPVKKLPSQEFDWKGLFVGKREPKPEQHWFRLMVPDDPRDRTAARKSVENALMTCYEQGSWVIVCDELRHLTDPKPPFLGLGPIVEHMWLKGRSRNISIIGASQEPRWLPGSFYSQGSFFWLGRIMDDRAHLRMTEIGGLTRKHIPQIASIPKRHWLYLSDGGDDTAITTVRPAGAKTSLRKAA